MMLNVAKLTCTRDAQTDHIKIRIKQILFFVSKTSTVDKTLQSNEHVTPN
jgi:hypothetical protein